MCPEEAVACLSEDYCSFLLQAGTQLPPLLEGDEGAQEGENSSADTAMQALSSQLVSSMDFGSGKLPTAQSAHMGPHLLQRPN